MLNVSLMGAKFGDGDLAALNPVNEQIVTADFSGSGLTDRSASAIAAMKRFRVLRLMRTKISDKTVHALSGLSQLESLNVFGTEVTSAALPDVGHLPKLQHFYAGETKIPAEIQVSEAFARRQGLVLTIACRRTQILFSAETLPCKYSTIQCSRVVLCCTAPLLLSLPRVSALLQNRECGQSKEIGNWRPIM